LTLSEQKRFPSFQHSQSPEQLNLIAKVLLQRLSSERSLELTSSAFKAILNAQDLRTNRTYPLSKVVQVALSQARALWLRSVTTADLDRTANLLGYLDRWFLWPEQAGLGRFCPITKLLFATIQHNQPSLRLLGDIRIEWQEHLIRHLAGDRSTEMQTINLNRTAETIIGIYLARQFAMQADEFGAYPVSPWIEMIKTNFRSG